MKDTIITRVKVVNNQATLYLTNGENIKGLKSNNSALKTLFELLKAGKISFKEVELISNELSKLKPEEFPMFFDEKEKHEFAEEAQNIYGPLAEALGDFANYLDIPDSPVTEAYLDICPKCGKHGRIIAKKCMTSTLWEKDKVEVAVKLLLVKGEIDGKEASKIREQLKNWKIPAEKVVS